MVNELQWLYIAHNFINFLFLLQLVIGHCYHQTSGIAIHKDHNKYCNTARNFNVNIENNNSKEPKIIGLGAGTNHSLI